MLTRGTKLSKNSSKSKPAQKLPSSGESTNPQIFGRTLVDDGLDKEKEIQSSKSKKRKRGQEAPERNIIVPAELDFFNDASGLSHKSLSGTASTNTKKQGMDLVREKISVKDSFDENAPQESLQTMSEEDRRRILREHKIKITIIEDPRAGNDDSTEKKKKKKKDAKKGKRSKDLESQSKKKQKIQLYPQPLTSFSQLQSTFRIPRSLAENITAQGYKMPTEVQLASLPLLLDSTLDWNTKKDSTPSQDTTDDRAPDLDLLAVAPTGSGKTLAFLVPVIAALIRERRTQGLELSKTLHRSGPKAIIIAPTKELAHQIVNEGRKLTQRTGIKVTLMKKGMRLAQVAENADIDENSDSSNDSEDENVNQPLVKSDIIVSSPLTLLNSLRNEDEDTTPLPGVQYLILDEADVLLDPLFREQTLAVWSACSNPSLRVSLWSATMGSSIEDLALSTIRARWDGDQSTAAARRPLIRLVVGLKDTALPTITHKLTYAATEQGKLLALRQLLRPLASSANDSTPLRPPFIVFTQTIPRAVALHSELQYDIPPEAGGSSRMAVLHSSLSDSAREDVMRRFRLGEVWILITTDLLSRGVDFRGVNGVVNYDVPTSAAAYVHRVGRTGRAGREGGVAVTLYAKEDIPYIKNVANVIAASERMRGGSDGSSSGEAAVPQWLLDALPTPSKRDKQRLKQRGVEERRAGLGKLRDVKEKRAARISTKSGYDRQLENRRKGAVSASLRRKESNAADEDSNSDEFEGFD